MSVNLPAAAVLESVQISVVGFGLAGVRLRTAGASGRGELQQAFLPKYIRCNSLFEQVHVPRTVHALFREYPTKTSVPGIST